MRVLALRAALLRCIVVFKSGAAVRSRGLLAANRTRSRVQRAPSGKPALLSPEGSEQQSAEASLRNSPSEPRVLRATIGVLRRARARENRVRPVGRK